MTHCVRADWEVTNQPKRITLLLLSVIRVEWRQLYLAAQHTYNTGRNTTQRDNTAADQYTEYSSETVSMLNTSAIIYNPLSPIFYTDNVLTNRSKFLSGSGLPFPHLNLFLLLCFYYYLFKRTTLSIYD